MKKERLKLGKTEVGRRKTEGSEQSQLADVTLSEVEGCFVKSIKR